MFVSLSKRHLLPKKVLVIPRNRWLRLNMTEKLFTGTLNHNKKKKKKKKTLAQVEFTVHALSEHHINVDIVENCLFKNVVFSRCHRPSCICSMPKNCVCIKSSGTS